MFRRGNLFQSRDPFGRIETEDDPAFETIRNNSTRQTAQTLGALDEAVGRDQPNKRSDVARVETLLAKNERFDTSRTDGPTGIFSTTLAQTIKDFQTDNGLKTDGVVKPLGETVSTLVQQMSDGGSEGEGGDEDSGEDNNGDGEGDSDSDEPKEQEPDERDCSSVEAELLAAEAELETAQGSLETAVSEKELLEASIASALSLLQSKQAQAENIQSKIEALQAQQEKENKDKFIYGKYGELFGRITGARGKKIGSEIGGAIFDDVGEAIESGVDFFTGQKTDAEIQQEISALSSQLSVIQADIATIQQEIAEPQAQIADMEGKITQLQASVDAAAEKVSSLQSALEACQSE